MFKFTIVVLIAIACASAKPGGLIAAPVAYSAPLIAPVGPAVVTSSSSQVIARNYNGLASPLVAAPLAYSAAPLAYNAAPLAYNAAPLAYNAAPLAYNAAPLAYNAAPFAYSAYSSPLVARAAYSPVAYASPVAPLKYTVL